MNIGKKRLTYFDIAKGICIIFVLLGHLQGDAIFKLSPYILYLCTWIFSFHMPFFFIVAGMLINYKQDTGKDFKNIIKKRFQSIIVPYFWFSVIYLIIVVYMVLFDERVSVYSLFENIWYTLSMYGINVLWFLPTLFFAEILFVYIAQHFSNIKMIITSLILLILGISLNCCLGFLPNNTTPLNILHNFIITVIRPVFANAFILIGYLLFNAISLMDTKLENKKTLLKLTEASILLISLVINVLLCKINSPVDFRSMVLKNYLLYYICATFGSLFVVMLGRFISYLPLFKNEHHFSLLVFYGKNSLVFMAVHNNSLILRLGLFLAMYANVYLTRARGYICYAIVILTILAYVTAMIFVINKFFPFLTGRKGSFLSRIYK